MAIELHPRVLELVVSRVCHDLVSPVGAINNGVELMEELGEDAGAEATKLIAHSATQASIRLKCFRLSYGAAGTDQNIGFKEIKDVFIDWLKAGRVQFEAEPDLAVKFSMPPRGFFKCLLNFLVLAEECGHGEAKITLSAMEGNKGVKILVTGNHIGFRDGAEAALKGDVEPDALDPRSVHAYIAGKFVAYFGLQFAFKSEADFGRMEFTLSF